MRAARTGEPALLPRGSSRPWSRGYAAKILDGRRVAQQWLSEIAEEVSELRSQLKRAPGLAVVLVGNRADSVLYVNRKRQAAAKVGINFDLIQLPEKVTQERLLERLDALFLDKRVDGVIVQLPLPWHIDEEVSSLLSRHFRPSSPTVSLTLPSFSLFSLFLSLL